MAHICQYNQREHYNFCLEGAPNTMLNITKDFFKSSNNCIGIYRPWNDLPPNCNFFGCNCIPDKPCCTQPLYDWCDPLEMPCDKKNRAREIR